MLYLPSALLNFLEGAAPSAAVMVSDRSYVSDFQWPAENSIYMYQQYYATGDMKGGELSGQHIRDEGCLWTVGREQILKKTFSEKSVDIGQGEATENDILREVCRHWTADTEKTSSGKYLFASQLYYQLL
jgi:hypothetical protein